MAPKNLSPTELAHKIIAELTPLADMLSPSDRRIIKRFCEYILQNRVSISNATSLLPLEAALVVVQVEEHENNNYQFSDLRNQLQELKREIEELKLKA
ncbi:MAG TPA: hypothetical protein VJM08_01860 [Anaerolineales bacterium]|nr:hypothetical protein [Anaerolineales bacterium]